MRALFLAVPGYTPARILSAWLQEGHDVAAFWCPKTVPAARWRKDRLLGHIKPSWSVSRQIRRHHISVRTVPKVLKRWEGIGEAVVETGADVLISAYTHCIVPDAVLKMFGNRAVNYHPALLPAYRGPAPRLAMLLDDKAEAYGGISLHVMSPKIDEGALIATRAVPYKPGMNFTDWEIAMADAAAALTRGPLQDHLSGKTKARPQPKKGASYTRRDFDETDLSSAMPADKIRRLLEVFGPVEPLRTFVNGRKVKVCRFKGVIGQPTGAPTEIHPFSVVMDARDGRVRLARVLPWTRKADAVRSFIRVLKA